jgi:hypothetical protein
MSIELVFKIANFTALFQWLLMSVYLFYPNNFTNFFLKNHFIILFLSVLYSLYILTNFGKQKGSFKSLEGISALFKNKSILLAGWIHYLAFDLFVGVWILKDSMSLGMNVFLTLICLFFTLMLGPIGLLIYSLIKLLN